MNVWIFLLAVIAIHIVKKMRKQHTLRPTVQFCSFYAVEIYHKVSQKYSFLSKLPKMSLEHVVNPPPPPIPRFVCLTTTENIIFPIYLKRT